MKLTKLALITGASFLLTATGCSQPSENSTIASMEKEQPIVSPDQQLSDVELQVTKSFLVKNPTVSTMLALPEDIAGGPYNGRLPDYSPDSFTALREEMANAEEQVNAIAKLPGLSEDKQYHGAILSNIFAYYAGDSDFPAGFIDSWGGHLPYIINQISGPLLEVPKLMQVQQSVASEQEAKEYLERLSAFGEFVDGVIAKFHFDMEKGIVLPKKLHPKTLAFFDAFLGVPAAEHELVKSFAERLDDVDNISDSSKAAYIEQATELVKSVVYPAYQRAQQAVLESEKFAKNDDGIWSQPGGDEFYRHEILFLGDSEFSPDEIHELGLSEVNRISAQMDAILIENGYTEGTVGERMVTLANLPGQVYPATDEGRTRLLNYLNEQIELIMAKAPQFYGTIPEQAVEVRRIPPVSEAGEASGFYTPPSLDGSRPGIYWINLRDMAAVPKFGLKTLTYHEAVPGHHFQIALNMAQQDIGLLRQNAPYNAYVEGWALYSEYFASEMMGMYDEDPLGDLGRLQAELYRAVRLVVDTGLHRKKWTREHAIDYFHSTTGTSLSDVVPEIERYMAWPGQALGYKMGMLTLVQLEKEARDALGDNFDIRAYHDIILLPGARPMEMVKADVAEWVSKQSR